jgi:Tfp pilus assembly protein PilE
MTSTAQKITFGIVVVALLGLSVVGVLVGAAVYGWKAAQKAGNEAATMQNMKTIAAVEIQYYNTHKRTFGTFDQLIKERMLTSKFSGDPPAPDGYVLILKVTPGSTDRQSSYTLNADPQSANTGKNHFYVDSASESIHLNPDQPAGATDPPNDD